MVTPAQPADVKAILRRELTARRDALPAAERQQAADTIAARAFPVAVPPGAIVSGFMPLKSEINPLPLLRELAAAGAALALPVVAGKGQAADHARLGFRRAACLRRLGHPGADAGCARRRSRYPDRTAARLRPPRHRLGYGAGYYDMTLTGACGERKPIVAVGIAYAAQAV